MCQRRDEWIMTDPAVNMFRAQICCVGIITASGPVYHWRGSEEGGEVRGSRGGRDSTGRGEGAGVGRREQVKI